MSNIVELREVSELITKGTTPTTVGGRFTNAGINFVKSESICDSKYLDSSVFMKIDEETDEKLKRSRLKERDLLVSIAGAYLGKLSIVRDVDLPANTNQAVGIVRINPEKADVDYLYYYFSQPAINGYINKLSAQSSQPNLNLDLLGKLTFNCLAIEDQVKVATVLSAIDKKIELNNRINAELESMAKTLYDYWFVQFDFPDDSPQGQGNPYKSSGGKIIYNPTLKREIPEGWSNEVLGKIINMERGVTYGKEDVLDKDNDNAIGVLRATNVTGNSVDINDLVYVPKSIVNQTQKIESFETIIVMSSGSKEHVGKNGIYYFDEPLGFGAFCSKIVPKKGARSFVNTFLQTTWFRAYIKNQCLGTNINNLTGDHINKCPIALPAKGLLERFEEVTGDIYQRISVNAIENQKLTALRDWLLPMLMNGQVTVK